MGCFPLQNKQFGTAHDFPLRDACPGERRGLLALRPDRYKRSMKLMMPADGENDPTTARFLRVTPSNVAATLLRHYASYALM
jgi:hypothetical protein